MCGDGPVFHLVVNPQAGRGRAARALASIIRALEALPGARLDVHESTSFDDARLRTRAAVAACRPATANRRADMLVVVGGDGMAHLGINACAMTEVPLGIIPAGTGNDFCRGAGLATRIPQAIAAVVAGRTRRIDLTRIDQRGIDQNGSGGAGVGAALDGAPRAGTRFVGSVLSTGYDARVNRRTNALGRRVGPFGALAYAGAALAELATFAPLHYRLEIDGEVRELPSMFVAVANAGFFGGGMHVCPGASVTDGLLDVAIIHPVDRTTLLRLLPRIYTGRHAAHPAVEQLRARTVTVDGGGLFAMGDGEELGCVPVTARSMAGVLSVVTP